MKDSSSLQPVNIVDVSRLQPKQAEGLEIIYHLMIFIFGETWMLAVRDGEETLRGTGSILVNLPVDIVAEAGRRISSSSMMHCNQYT